MAESCVDEAVHPELWDTCHTCGSIIGGSANRRPTRCRAGCGGSATRR